PPSHPEQQRRIGNRSQDDPSRRHDMVSAIKPGRWHRLKEIGNDSPYGSNRPGDKMSATLKEAGRSAVAQNQQGILQFLSQFPPFDQMEASHLLNLIEHARLRFFPAGQVVLQPQDGIVDKWF